jgi:hypothetical protein
MLRLGRRRLSKIAKVSGSACMVDGNVGKGCMTIQCLLGEVRVVALGRSPSCSQLDLAFHACSLSYCGSSLELAFLCN